MKAPVGSGTPERRRGPIVLAANTTWYIHNFRGTLIDALLPENRVVAVGHRDEYADRLEARGCRVVHVPFVRGSPSVPGEVRTLLTLGRWYRRLRPEIVLNFTSRANVYSTLAARPSGATVVNNISGFGRAFPGSDRSGGVGALAGLIGLAHRLIGRRAAHTFYQNHHDLEVGVRRGFSSPARSSLLPGSGVDLRRFRPVSMPAVGPVHFVHVARLMREKGLFDFIEAARIVRTELGGAVTFSIAGPDAGLGPGERERFGAALEEVGIEYLGMIDDVENLLAEAHCAVLPSTYAEGVPRSLIEAAAVGRVLVAYRNPGCEEIVRDGETGWIVPAGDVVALAERLISVAMAEPEERSSMGRRAAAVARDEFDEAIVVRSYLDVIRRCREGSI